jgi:signal transduction histidine kinase
VDELFINADKLKIHELFNNILNNAVKYSNGKGIITIHGTHEHDHVLFSVKDTGIGMNDEQLSHIFDEFYKADPSRHDFDSSGLGMSIAKRIVEKHGGSIWAKSKGIGKGSTFYFTLPAPN